MFVRRMFFEKCLHLAVTRGPGVALDGQHASVTTWDTACVTNISHSLTLRETFSAQVAGVILLLILLILCHLLWLTKSRPTFERAHS